MNLKSFLFSRLSFAKSADSEIPKDRIIRLHGPIHDELANRVITELLFHHMENPKLPISLEIDSPGGSVTAGFAILDTMAFVQNPIETVCRTYAHGMAVVLFAAGASG